MKYYVRLLVVVCCMLFVGSSCWAQRDLQPLIKKVFGDLALPLETRGLPVLSSAELLRVFPEEASIIPPLQEKKPEQFVKQRIELQQQVTIPVTFNYPVKWKGKQKLPAELRLLTKRHTDAVIFDLDGTLLDSLWAWEHSGSNYLRSIGIEPTEELDEELAQMSLADGARLVKEMYNLADTPSTILANTLIPIRVHYELDIQAKPKVPILLEFLHAQGIKMAVATASDSEFATLALDRLGLLDYFEFIITCDEVGVGKRNPLIYEEARRRLGASKSRMVVVEDALYALKTAHRAGFKTIGVAEKKEAQYEDEIRRIVDAFLTFD